MNVASPSWAPFQAVLGSPMAVIDSALCQGEVGGWSPGLLSLFFQQSLPFPCISEVPVLTVGNQGRAVCVCVGGEGGDGRRNWCSPEAQDAES